MRRPGRRAGAQRLLGGLALAAMALSCGGRAPLSPLVPGEEPLPDRIEAVHPPARSRAILYDTAIWAQFTGEVDTATVNDRTVFFKADTRRLERTLRWDPDTRRLWIVPAARLDLRRTYTVELSGSIRFADGTTLGQTHSWQFTTNSLRRPGTPLPEDGQLETSPFTVLAWGDLTESEAGPVTYEIHASPDSATAADPSAPAVATVSGPPFLPRTRWRQEEPTYWAVHAFNAATGERLVGPVWRFDTFPANAACDSITVPVVDWTWIESNNPSRQRCNLDSLAVGPAIVSTVRWNLGPPDLSLRLCSAAIEFTPRYSTVPAVTGPSVWAATAEIEGCQLFYPGPPWADEMLGPLALAEVIAPDRIRFSGDALTAHLEATGRLGGFYGYLFRSPLRRSYYGPGVGSLAVRAVLKLYLYRPSGGPVPGSAVRTPTRRAPRLPLAGGRPGG